MLLGRDRERQPSSVCWPSAAGRARVLALVGEAGIGKTALLDHAAGTPAGCRCCGRAASSPRRRSRSRPARAAAPGAGGARPDPGAAGGGARRARSRCGPAGAQERFAVGAATLSLLAAYAEEGAARCVLVDDAQWLDGSSAEALLFAVPPAGGRSDRGAPRRRATASRRCSTAPICRRSRLGGLEPRGGRGARWAGSAPATRVERLHEATAGQPAGAARAGPRTPSELALAPEGAPVPVSAQHLARPSCAGSEALPEREPPHAWCSRPPATAATVDAGARGAVARPRPSTTLAAAENAGLVSVAGWGARVPPPAGALGGLRRCRAPRSGARRTAALAAPCPIATSTGAPGTSPRPRSAPTTRPRPRSSRPASRARDAERLRGGGRRLRARGAARRPTERAARRLLLAAADAAWLAGPARPGAWQLLDEARASAPDERLGDRIEQLRGHIAMRRGPLMRGPRDPRGGRRAGGRRNPERAVVMLAEAADACFYAGDAAEMLLTAERAYELVPAGRRRRARASSRRSRSAWRRSSRATARRARRIQRGASAIARVPRTSCATTRTCSCGLRSGRSSCARPTPAACCSTARSTYARERSAVGALPYLLHAPGPRPGDDGLAGPAAQARLPRGDRASRARPASRRSSRLRLSGLAWLEARQGTRGAAAVPTPPKARALCTQLGMRLLRGLGACSRSASSSSASGAAEQRCGALRGAASAARGARHRPTSTSRRPPSWSRPTCGSGARTTRPRSCRRARGRAPRPRGSPGRSPARPAPAASSGRTSELDEHFDAGARAARRRRPTCSRPRAPGWPTASVCAGRASACGRREQLRAALETFDAARRRAVGRAGPRRARGHRRDGAGGATRARSTSSRRRSCRSRLLLAEGRTTREAAAALFLSPKTIEYHLRHVYRKLDIRSREQLTAAFAGRRERAASPG